MGASVSPSNLRAADIVAGAGAVGVWTEADSVIAVDDFSCGGLAAERRR